MAAKDKTIIIMDVLVATARGLYNGLNATSDQVILGMRGALAELEKDVSGERTETGRCIDDFVTELRNMPMPKKMRAE